MPKITTKKTQQHIECVCGHGTIDGQEMTLTHHDLCKLGYKRKRDKNTGEIFYNRHQVLIVCECGSDDHYDNNSLYPDDLECASMVDY